MAKTILSDTPISVDEFRLRMSELWKSQREELERIAGSPVDPSRIPKDFWKEQAEQRRRILAILLYGVSLSFYSYDFIDLEEYDEEASSMRVRQSMQDYARSRARVVSDLMGRTSRNRSSEFGYDEIDMDDDSFDLTEHNEGFLDRIYGDDRLTQVSGTELTAAQSIARQSVADEADRIDAEYHHIWRVSETCDHCDLCLLLDGCDESFWGRFVGPPPIHPNCCCSTILIIGRDAQELIDGGLLVARNPSARDVRSSLNDHGYRNVWSR